MEATKRHYDSGQTIIIKRTDVKRVESYARDHRDLRDYLLIRLPMKIGLRTHEIATLTVEDIDFESRSFQVLDSKKHRFYPLPLDPVTLQLIKDLIGDRTEGVVFQHKTYKRKNQGKPLRNVSIWKTIKTIGEEAGVKHFYPRILRHYCAANMIYPEPDEYGNRPEPARIETVRRILRHKKPGMTHTYLARLVFFEDIQWDYERTQNPYVAQAEDYRQIKQVEFSDKNRFYEESDMSLTPNYQEWCSKCDHEPICKFLPEFCASKCAASCKYFMVKEQVIKKLTV